MIIQKAIGNRVALKIAMEISDVPLNMTHQILMVRDLMIKRAVCMQWSGSRPVILLFGCGIKEILILTK